MIQNEVEQFSLDKNNLFREILRMGDKMKDGDAIITEEIFTDGLIRMYRVSLNHQGKSIIIQSPDIEYVNFIKTIFTNMIALTFLLIDLNTCAHHSGEKAESLEAIVNQAMTDNTKLSRKVKEMIDSHNFMYT